MIKAIKLKKNSIFKSFVLFNVEKRIKKALQAKKPAITKLSLLKKYANILKIKEINIKIPATFNFDILVHTSF